MTSLATRETEGRVLAESLHNLIEELLVLLGIKLSPEQEDVFWDYSRVEVVGGGEGAGKTFLAALKAVLFNEAQRQLDLLMDSHAKPKLVWIVGADFEDTRMCLDSYITPWLKELGLMDYTKSSASTHLDQPAITVSKSGNIYKSISAYDPLKIGREEPDCIIAEEVSRLEKEVWDRLYGRLARKYPYSWMYASGSFESSLGWFPEVWKLGQGPNELDYSSWPLPSWANPHAYPLGRDDPALLQLEKQTTPHRFLERFGGIPTVPKDAVFPEFKRSLHVYPFEYVEGEPLSIFIDPGGGKEGIYAVLFVNTTGEGVRVLDELYLQNATHEQVVGATIANPLWKHVRMGIIDVAGRAQSMQGFGSAVEAWRRDTGLQLKSQYHKVQVTVERIRNVLLIDPRTQRPRLAIHPRCRGIISEFGGGPSPVGVGGLWRMKGGRPSAENDHAIKALGYGLLGLYGTTNPYLNEVSPNGDDFDEDYDPYVASYLRRV